MIEDVKNFEILTDDLEKNQRLALCNTCEKKIKINEIETCDGCACPIDYVITYKFKNCPIGKWSN